MLNRIQGRPGQRRGAKAVITVLLLLLFILASCGKKSPPLPPIDEEGALAPLGAGGVSANQVAQSAPQ